MDTSLTSDSDDQDDKRFFTASSTHKRKRGESNMSRKDKRKEERKNKKLKRVTQSEASLHSKTEPNSKTHKTHVKAKAKSGKSVSFTDSEIYDFDKTKAPTTRLGGPKSARLADPVSDNSDFEGDFGFDDFGDSDDFEGFDDDEELDDESASDVMAKLKAAKEAKNNKAKKTETAEDVMAQLKAAKEAKNKKSNKTDTAEDVMAQLKAAKEAKNKKAKNAETAEDVMAQLKAIKEAKSKKTKESDAAEDVMAKLKGAKEAKKSKNSSASDSVNDVMAQLKAAKEAKNKKKNKSSESAEDVMAQLKAAKEAKKNKKEHKEGPKKKSSLADLIASRESAGAIEASSTSSSQKKKSNAVLTSAEKQQMKQDEDDIAYYAKMLGMKEKTGKMPKSTEEEDDGLDNLLDGLDLDFGDGYDHLDSDGEEIPDLVQGSEDDQGEGMSDLEGSDEQDLEGLPFSSDDQLNSDDFDSDEDLEGLDDDDDDDDEDQDGEENSNEEDGFDEDEDGSESEEEEEAPKRENPYVAPTAGKYVPPSRRALDNNTSESKTKLRRIVKGLFNKLTEANIATIVSELNNLYLHHPRNDVTSVITDIVIESTSMQGTLLEGFLMVHAALITAIYKVSGVEFGAHYLQTHVENFDKHYKGTGPDSVKTYGKEANNLLALLAELYSFGFVSCGLIYDLIRMFLDGDINEAKTELLLKLVRTSGSQLRSDDPAALKEIIHQLQVSVSKADPASINTRTKFLVETISELKNNRQKRAGVSEATSAAKIRMKKFLGSVQGKMSEPMRVSLDDIRNVETRGKWWLVGSAWRNQGGNSNGHQPGSTVDEDDVDLEVMGDILENAEPDWMELARQQRMNTDVRRAVFVALMSSEDYVDACDKLERLKLKSKQEREIPRVILHCCCNEEVYNPFYQVVATRLCGQRSIRKTFQFALWDFLSDLEVGNQADDDSDSDLDPEEKMEKLRRRGDTDDTELTDEQKLRKAVHMARLYASFTAEGIVNLDILKTANFVSPTPGTQVFLELFFITLYTKLAKKRFDATNRKKMSFGDAMFQKQKIDEKGLVQLLVKTSENADKSALLLKKIKFFQRKLLKSSAITGKSQREKVEWGVNVTTDVIDELSSKTVL